MWALPLPRIQKARLWAFAWCHYLTGPYQAKTFVTPLFEKSEVHHTTILSKFGIWFFRSEKVFLLASNGSGITLSGHEFYWPFLSRKISFPPQTGFVHPGAESAQYQMPLAGIPCHCEAIMSKNQGTITLQENWISGTFTLTAESFALLRERFAEENRS